MKDVAGYRRVVMSDIKKWGSDDESKFTDISKGTLRYNGDKNPEITLEGSIGRLSLFKAAPDTYKALEEMCDMWTTVCDAQGWEPEHMVQYENAVTSLAQARGECHE